MHDSDLTTKVKSSLQRILDEAFEGDFSDEDWQHTCGGLRFLGYTGDQLIAHGAVVKRWMEVDGNRLLVGYVEGVAVAPSLWGKGIGSLLMAELSSYCKSEFQLSMLSTDEKYFYRKNGWLDFMGRSYVFEGGIEIESVDENEGLMYLHGLNQFKDGPQKVVCESRDGDAW